MSHRDSVDLPPRERRHKHKKHKRSSSECDRRDDDQGRGRNHHSRREDDASPHPCSASTGSSRPKTDHRAYPHSSRSRDYDHLTGKRSPDHDQSDTEEVQDFDFDFTQYKSGLNRIFFREEDIIRRGTRDYDEFWAFLKRYQEFQRKRFQTQGKRTAESTSDERTSGPLDIPMTYDNRYRVNMSVVSKDVETFLKKGRLVDYETDKNLTRERVVQFRKILLHFLDFQQKQKFAKLKKIRHDQENLPIFQFKTMISNMLRRHQIMVVAGDTGCGKSTQVPQYLMEAGFDKIACTQPRRIACISLSKRVGYETLNEYGSQVAYQVRFEKSRTRASRIIFLTEGLLLRQMTSDTYLSQYSVIIVDEVHERHIFTDFLLGVLQCLLKQRQDLKLVLMSATINIDLFSSYFDNAPVIKVPGRLYPIDLEYRPIKREAKSSRSERLDPTPYIRIMQLIDHKYPATERGDLLIFLSGMTEIMTVVEAARTYAQQVKSWIVLPLHSALSVEEQDKVFDIAPEGARKCIVSTNIAETSVTIDGVRFIADSGKVKEMSFDPKYKMQRLQEFWISRASAEQRKGRAGRTGPGVCFRLYEEPDYEAFQQYTTPEIQRVPLDALILQLMAMGLPDARKFPFLEAPAMSSIENSIQFLKEQGALTEDEELTPMGEMLSQLPVDVVIGKMLIMGSVFNMIDPVLSVAAAMSVQSPFTMKAHSDREAIAARKPLESDHGDPFTLLNAFDEWIQVKAEGRGTQKWCKRRGLEEQRFYEMTKLKRQFKELLQDQHLLERLEDRWENLTSEQRRQKHGERRKLGQLKRTKQQESRKRKVLKLEDDDFGISDGEDNDEGEDLKDLEFRLSHNLNELQETSNKRRSFRLRDINLMKVILCSGLYPQVAIPDECNTYKRDSEQAFHTKSKPFILLHPTSVFAAHPEFLQPKDSKETPRDFKELRNRVSPKHELLAYVSLLETNKPYLVNALRVPALQTVTLFANAIDTNASCTRMVCDGWLEVKLQKEEEAEEIIQAVVTLRTTWGNLLRAKLEDKEQGRMEKRVSRKAVHLERLLARKLAEFLDSNVPYTLRRVLPAETQRLYIGPMPGLPQSEKGDGEGLGQEHPIKGGTRVTSYLTVNCLLDDETAGVVDEYTSCMQRHWSCPHCQQSLVLTLADRLRHQSQCQDLDSADVKEEEAKEEEKEHQAQMNPLRREYFCEQCDQTLMLTSTEILKHKKSHS